jgi:hypothetical protein
MLYYFLLFNSNLVFFCFAFLFLFLTDKPPLPVMNIINNNNSVLKNEDTESSNSLSAIDERKNIYSDNLSEVNKRSPRSRAAVLISLPAKVQTIDFEEEEYNNNLQQQQNDYIQLNATSTSVQNSLAFNNSTYISNKNTVDNNTKGIRNAFCFL